MLYDRWRTIAHENRNLIALRDLARGAEWTFQELALATENRSQGAGLFAFPQGVSPEFILALLSAWRHGQVVCPVEVGQNLPSVPEPPANIVHLKITSATTGASRIIAFSACQLMADADNIVATMGLRPEWPNLGIISLAHSYGFSNLVLPLLLHGIPLNLIGSALPEGLRKALEICGPSTLAAVPALWRGWHEANAILSNVRLAISAGAPLPLSLERAVFEQQGIKIHNFYGASECGGIAYDAVDVPRTDAACVGSPLRNVHISVDEENCLEVRSTAVAESYWPESSPALGKGRFQSSDLAELANGHVYLRGRLGHVINIAGRKVAPETIEAVLLAHPAVRECLVFGVNTTENERTETIVACVATKTPLPANSLRQFMLQRLPAWQVPREWHFEEIETDLRGKLSRSEWRKRYLAARK